MPRLSPLPDPLPSSLEDGLTRLESAFHDMFAAAGATGGVATVVYDQTTLMTYGYGSTRNDGSGSNITGDSVFRIGSVSKVCVRVCLVCVLCALA
jgi:CubicO group peptidase (beta-lactamase class C family)